MQLFKASVPGQESTFYMAVPEGTAPDQMPTLGSPSAAVANGWVWVCVEAGRVC